MWAYTVLYISLPGPRLEMYVQCLWVPKFSLCILKVCSETCDGQNIIFLLNCSSSRGDVRVSPQDISAEEAGMATVTISHTCVHSCALQRVCPHGAIHVHLVQCHFMPESPMNGATWHVSFIFTCILKCISSCWFIFQDGWLNQSTFSSAEDERLTLVQIFANKWCWTSYSSQFSWWKYISLCFLVKLLTWR